MSEGNGVLRIPEGGQAKFQLGDGAVFEIDLTETFNRFYEIDRECGEDFQRINARYQQLLAELSGGPCTQAQARAFVDLVIAQLEEFKKKLTPIASSPGATASTPGN